MLGQTTTVLFQGDSITDAGRNREGGDPLGQGYAMMIAAWYSALFPEDQTTFLNRGISGHRTIDLVNRWQKDCVDLKPDVLSILIGINDTWRAVDSNDPTTVDQFEENYRKLLDATVDQLEAEIILLEPFVLPNQVRYDDMRTDLNPKIEVVRKLAREYKTILIPLDGLFQQACTEVAPSHWSGDGVHLTPAGNAFVAQTWLDTAECLF